MKPYEFLNCLDQAAVVAAIREAERGTSGKIRVFVSLKTPPKDGVYSVALREFKRLGLNHVGDRNAVLLYIAPKTREVAIVADEGIQSKSGALPWRQIIASFASEIKLRDVTPAVCGAIHAIGKTLAKYYSRKEEI